MGTKSKHHVALDEKEQDRRNSSGKRKKEKRRSSKNSKNDGKKDNSAMKSIRKTLRNRLQRIKGSNGKKHDNLITTNSATDTLATEEAVMLPPRAPLPPKPVRNPPTPKKEKQSKQSSTVRKEKKAPSPVRKSTPKQRREVSKERKVLPIRQKVAEETPKKKQPKERPRSRSKSEKRSRSKSLNSSGSKKSLNRSRAKPPQREHGLNRMNRPIAKKATTKKKKKIVKPEAPKPRNEFRSFSDSSDYSDTDFESYPSPDESDASSTYSDPGYDVISSADSDAGSEMGSGLDSDSSASDSSGSYTTEEEDRMMAQRTAVHRNPDVGRGRSRKPRRKQASESTHISSPRSSPRKTESQHIPSPRKSTGRSSKNRFFPDDEVEDDEVEDEVNSHSDESSYATETSYDSSESESDTSSSSGSSYSDSGSYTNDEYYTTSYDDDPRNIHDSTFSGSWTDRPLSTNGSEETERTNHTNQKRGVYYPTLHEESSSHSTDESDQYSESQKTTHDGDLGSIAESEYNAFVKEQEIEEKKKKEFEELQKQQQNSGGIFSWIFGGTTISTETTSLPEPLKIDTRDEREHVTAKKRIKSKKGRRHKSTEKLDDDRVISSPHHSPRSTRSEQQTRLPPSPLLYSKSPQSAASSRNDFIVRDRRSAIFMDDDVVKDRRDVIEPALSPGCSMNIDEILHGDSMPGSYGGLQEGEFLLSNLQSRSSPKEESIATGEAQSVTLRGSGSFETNAKSAGAPNEISFEPRSPSNMSSPRVELSATGEETTADSLFCCFSPSNAIGQDDGKIEKDLSRMVESRNGSTAFAFNDSVASTLDVQGENDETTCASTINTEGFQDLKSKTEDQSKLHAVESSAAVDEEKNLQYHTIPLSATEYPPEDEKDEDAEEIEMEPGSYHGDSNEIDERTGNDNMEAIENNNFKEPIKKAEDLDDYNISEILHGKRSFKSKTDDDGQPILLSRSSSPTGKRERRKNALKAHRDFLYKSHSIDTNPDSTNEDNASDKDKGKNKEDKIGSSETSTEGPSTSTGPSVLSNSIVHDDVSRPHDDSRPDALMELVRNAFTVMMTPAIKDTPESTTPVDSGADAAPPNDTQGNDNAKPTLASPVNEMLEVAFRFFGQKEETEGTQRGQKATLEVIDFDPNKTTEESSSTESNNQTNEESPSTESKEAASTEEFSSSVDITNPSDEAVLRDSRHNSSSQHSKPTDTVLDESRFNADGIPLELRPKKIWRAFDSGFSVSASVLTGPSTVSGDLASIDMPKTAIDEYQTVDSTFDKNLQGEFNAEEAEKTEQVQADSINAVDNGEENKEHPDSAVVDEELPKAVLDKPEVETQPLRIETNQIENNLESEEAKQEENPLELGSPDLDPPDLTPPNLTLLELSAQDRSPRLSGSPRFKRRNDMKRLKKYRLHQPPHDQSQKEPEPTAIHSSHATETSHSLSPRKERRESFGKHPERKSISLSPTKRPVRKFEHERGDHNNNSFTSNVSLMKQHFEHPISPRIVMAEDRDATAMDEQAKEQSDVERSPPSPTTPTMGDENNEETEKANPISSNSKVSDVRSRIKERRKLRLRQQQVEREQQEQKQQEQEQIQQQQIEDEQHLVPQSNFNSVVDSEGQSKQQTYIAEDGKEYPLSPIKDDGGIDEFYDAMTFEDQDEEETNTEIEVASPAKKYLSSPVKYLSSPHRDRDDYLALSYKNSIISGVMSLD